MSYDLGFMVPKFLFTAPPKRPKITPLDLPEIIMDRGPQTDSGEPFLHVGKPMYFVDADWWEFWVERNEFPKSINFCPRAWQFKLFRTELAYPPELNAWMDNIYITVGVLEPPPATTNEVKK